MKKANRSLKNKKTRSSLRVEALEQRQLLAAITGQGTEVLSNVVHSNGNVYDQVLMTGSSVTVTADAGQVTRVSFLDLQGDIVQAEFSGAGSMTISLDSFVAAAAATKYAQPGVSYVSGLASFTIQGSDASTNFSTFSVGTSNAHRGVDNPIFAGGLTGGNNYADVARLAIVADPSNASGSTFGGIRAGNAIFSAASGTVGIAAANVQVQDVVTIGDIAATSTGTPTLVFGTNSQFSNVTVAGGDLVQANSVAINNAGSYGYKLVLAAGTTSAGTALAAQPVSDTLTFTGTNPTNVGGQSFTLTSGIDTFTGGGAKDTFTAALPTDLGAFDAISGGDGIDTLRINDLAAGVNLGAYTTANSTISGIENVEIQAADATAMVVSLESMTGLNKVTITNTASATTLTTKANATEVILVGFATGNVSITDSTGTDTLATVTVSGNTTGTVTVDSSALATLSLSNSSGNVTTSPASGGATARTYNLNGVTGGTILDTKTTGVTINSVTAANSAITLTTAAATGVTINATSADITLADVNIAAATGITINGSKAVTVSAATTVTVLASVNAGAATGAVTVTPVLPVGATYTGSAGVDTISLGVSTKATTTGAGNDSVTFTSTSVITGTVDAGDGTDSMTMTATIADALDGATTFNGKVSNFERLVITGPASETVNLTNIDGISNVSSSGATSLTLKNMADAGTLELTAAGTAYTVEMLSITGANDTLNLTVKNGAATTYGSVTLKGLDASSVLVTDKVETVNITTDDTTGTGDTMTLAVVDADATTINVSGDGGLALTFAGVKLTTLNAAGVTAGSVSYTSGALTSASTLTGGAGADTIDAALSTKAVTLSGGAGNDALTGSSAVGSTITGGAGTDTLVGGTGADIIDGGADVDSISSGTGLDILTGGAGNDTFTITTPLNGNSYATITDAAAGDIIDLSNKGTATWNSTKITLAATAAFQDFLDAATAGDGSTNGINRWFTYGGDTYIVQDISALSTFVNGADTVVKLTGEHDLSTSATTIVAATSTITLGG
jgi:S-layer protein